MQVRRAYSSEVPPHFPRAERKPETGEAAVDPSPYRPYQAGTSVDVKRPTGEGALPSRTVSQASNENVALKALLDPRMLAAARSSGLPVPDVALRLMCSVCRSKPITTRPN
jgi:hypothetical protein